MRSADQLAQVEHGKDEILHHRNSSLYRNPKQLLECRSSAHGKSRLGTCMQYLVRYCIYGT